MSADKALRRQTPESLTCQREVLGHGFPQARLVGGADPAVQAVRIRRPAQVPELADLEAGVVERREPCRERRGLLGELGGALSARKPCRTKQAGRGTRSCGAECLATEFLAPECMPS